MEIIDIKCGCKQKRCVVHKWPVPIISISSNNTSKIVKFDSIEEFNEIVLNAT